MVKPTGGENKFRRIADIVAKIQKMQICISPIPRRMEPRSEMSILQRAKFSYRNDVCAKNDRVSISGNAASEYYRRRFYFMGISYAYLDG